jgi:hypothetical protein
MQCWPRASVTFPLQPDGRQYHMALDRTGAALVAWDRNA